MPVRSAGRARSPRVWRFGDGLEARRLRAFGAARRPGFFPQRHLPPLSVPWVFQPDTSRRCQYSYRTCQTKALVTIFACRQERISRGLPIGRSPIGACSKRTCRLRGQGPFAMRRNVPELAVAASVLSSRASDKGAAPIKHRTAGRIGVQSARQAPGCPGAAVFQGVGRVEFCRCAVGTCRQRYSVSRCSLSLPEASG